MKVYLNNIYHRIIETDISTDGRIMIHIPENITAGINNKYFHVDLVEVEAMKQPGITETETKKALIFKQLERKIAENDRVIFF